MCVGSSGDKRLPAFVLWRDIYTSIQCRKFQARRQASFEGNGLYT